MSEIKVGDLVRFLNATGGGVVKSISSKGIVSVEDESGFDIPVLINEVVVVTEGSTIYPKPVTQRPSQPSPVAAPQPQQQVKSEPKLSQSRRHTDREGERLNVSLAYLPMDPSKIGEGKYEAYLINESNYDLSVLYMSGAEVRRMTVRYHDKVSFDSSVFLEDFAPDELPDRLRTRLQIIAFKPGELFEPKAVYDLSLRIDGSRFFKKHAFVDNDFFDDPAIIYDLIRDDEPVSRSRVGRPLNTSEQADAPIGKANRHQH